MIDVIIVKTDLRLKKPQKHCKVSFFAVKLHPHGVNYVKNHHIDAIIFV